MKAANNAPAPSVVDFLRDGITHFRLFSWLRGWKRPARQLRVRETLSLGNRGMLAVVAFREQEFLVGCTSTSIALLARLSADEAQEMDRVQLRVGEE
ncbi:MAG: flagellar biosynthetic protein FliO [Candidatus Acidiferrales bacterium]